MKEMIDCIKHLLYKYDPIGLVSMHCLKDEYELGVQKIANRMKYTK